MEEIRKQAIETITMRLEELAPPSSQVNQQFQQENKTKVSGYSLETWCEFIRSGQLQLAKKQSIEDKSITDILALSILSGNQLEINQALIKYATNMFLPNSGLYILFYLKSNGNLQRLFQQDQQQLDQLANNWVDIVLTLINNLLLIDKSTLQQFLYSLALLLLIQSKKEYATFCFLLSGKPLTTPQFPFIFSNNEVISLQLSEIYSYSKSRVIPMKLIFSLKYVYVLQLLDYGYIQKAQEYLQDILQSDTEHYLQTTNLLLKQIKYTNEFVINRNSNIQEGIWTYFHKSYKQVANQVSQTISKAQSGGKKHIYQPPQYQPPSNYSKLKQQEQVQEVDLQQNTADIISPFCKVDDVDQQQQSKGYLFNQQNDFPKPAEVKQEQNQNQNQKFYYDKDLKRWVFPNDPYGEEELEQEQQNQQKQELGYMNLDEVEQGPPPPPPELFEEQSNNEGQIKVQDKQGKALHKAKQLYKSPFQT